MTLFIRHMFGAKAKALVGCFHAEMTGGLSPRGDGSSQDAGLRRSRLVQAMKWRFQSYRGVSGISRTPFNRGNGC